jgi:dihydroorotate dehydrogenase electron transfer subunit
MANRIFQTKAKLIKNIEVIKNYYKIVLLCPEIAKEALPGQFVQVKVNAGYEPLLRRPFGIHRVRHKDTTPGLKGQAGVPLSAARHKSQEPGEQIEILYQVLGPGTEALAKRKSGEYLDIIGPLGNGFEFRTEYRVPSTAILVAGGMGVAPLVFLAEKLAGHKDTRTQGHKTIVLVGAKTKKQLLCTDDLKQLGCDVRVATDDGSKGFKGRVTDLLKKFLHGTRYTVHCTIYACGPRPMLKKISRLAKQYNLPAQVSLEEHMACGIGACLGCVVNTIDGYKRVCKEGPVFQAKEIVF